MSANHLWQAQTACLIFMSKERKDAQLLTVCDLSEEKKREQNIDVFDCCECVSLDTTFSPTETQNDQ